MSIAHIYDTEVKDAVKVLELDVNKKAEEIESIINKTISELGGYKVLGINSNIKQNGNIVILIHHLSK